MSHNSILGEKQELETGNYKKKEENYKTDKTQTGRETTKPVSPSGQVCRKAQNQYILVTTVKVG